MYTSHFIIFTVDCYRCPHPTPLPQCILSSVDYQWLTRLSADSDSDTSLLTEEYKVFFSDSLVQILKNTDLVTPDILSILVLFKGECSDRVWKWIREDYGQFYIFYRIPLHIQRETLILKLAGMFFILLGFLTYFTDNCVKSKILYLLLYLIWPY